MSHVLAKDLVGTSQLAVLDVRGSAQERLILQNHLSLPPDHWPHRRIVEHRHTCAFQLNEILVTSSSGLNNLDTKPPNSVRLNRFVESIRVVVSHPGIYLYSAKGIPHLPISTAQTLSSWNRMKTGEVNDFRIVYQ